LQPCRLFFRRLFLLDNNLPSGWPGALLSRPVQAEAASIAPLLEASVEVATPDTAMSAVVDVFSVLCPDAYQAYNFFLFLDYCLLLLLGSNRFFQLNGHMQVLLTTVLFNQFFQRSLMHVFLPVIVSFPENFDLRRHSDGVKFVALTLVFIVISHVRVGFYHECLLLDQV
jgi:hypothetical protein